MAVFQKLTYVFATVAGLSVTEPAFAGPHFQDIDPDECNRLIKTGEASYYGDEVAIGHDKHGNLIFNPTYNGEKFNPDALTAAFRDTDFMGEYLRVVLSATNEDVIVRVNDLGPFAQDKKGRDRVIDLTQGAAEDLGMDGVAWVRVYACD